MQSNGKICLIKNIATILLFAVSFSANCETKNPYFYQPTDIMSQTNQASEILSQEVISDGWAEASFGRGFLESTYLIEAVQGTEMSRRINDIRYQSYENAYGQKISMYKFYKTNWTDARFNWLTQIDKDYGIIWGFTTGERGRKYNINPSLTIGFLRQFEIDSRTTFSIRLSTQFGGRLTEKPCVADYGAFGEQKVNCRLAATQMTPEETLNYLFNEKPNNNQFMIIYKHIF